MKVIIAGSRSIQDFEAVVAAIDGAGFDIDIVVSGGAEGVDTLGERWAYENGVPVMPFDITEEMVKQYGKWEAPKVRNEQMAQFSDGLIAVWDQQSGGTKHMIQTADEYGLNTHVHQYNAMSLGDFVE